jgi:GT2 family glycosyltransferase
MEFVHRLQKLGYRLEMLDNNILYHFYHERKSDSLYNNFFRSNEAEWENVVAMDEAQRSGCTVGRPHTLPA